MDAAGVIHLDANATTPLLPEVLEAMLPWLKDGFANPSGAYAGAKLARKAIGEARGKVAALIGALPEEIVFTGGGTESVNTALHSLDELCGEGAVVVSAIEHSAVLRYVETLGREVRSAPVDTGGRVLVEKFAELLPGAAFASVMTANNETGVIQPIPELAAEAKKLGIPFHTDAIQAAGKFPVPLAKCGADLISLSAHKFHGPKGMGALWIRSGLRFVPLLQGGGQESGRRSGTENVPGIVGMGAAAEAMARAAEDGSPGKVREMRDAFESKVVAEISGVTANGDRDHRLPNTSHLSFDGCEAAGLLILLDDMGVACSAGSACMTGKQKPSHVQLAMGIPEARAKSSLRISFSLLNTMEEAIAAADAVKKAVEKLRRVQGIGVGPVTVYTP
jgi:cysteine desulfurase